MNKLIIIVMLLSFWQGFSQKVLNVTSKNLTVSVNREEEFDWEILPEENPNLLGVECKFLKNSVVFSDGKNSARFVIEKGQEIDFVIVINQTEKINIRLVGISPNVNFTSDYIAQHKGKTSVQIHEVSELMNILLALHKDAEKDYNMFDTQGAYYKRVKEYFAPYRNHLAIALIEQNMPAPEFNQSVQRYLFSKDSYHYYYALKMNATAYDFDEQGHIKNNGIIREVGVEWHTFDPMRDVAVFEDFAKKSNFRKFYQDNKPYYDELLATYNKLAPVQQMQAWLDKKFGSGYDSYLIFFSPLNRGAQATVHFDNNNFKQAFMFICQAKFDKQYSQTMNELLSSWVVFTEIDHNYVNPLSSVYGNFNRINNIFSNRKLWAVGEGASMYKTPYEVFNEYMTFALFTLYANDYYSKEDVEKFMPLMEPMMENTRGFIRFKDFNRTLLEKYRQNPNATIQELYDYMLSWAEKINQSE